MAKATIAPYTLFIILAVLLSLVIMFLIILKFMQPSGKVGEKLCEAKRRMYCASWKAMGYLEENRPKGYDFSGCKEKYGIDEPTAEECKDLLG